MRTIVFSGQYKKDLKLARKRNLFQIQGMPHSAGLAFDLL